MADGNPVPAGAHGPLAQQAGGAPRAGSPSPVGPWEGPLFIVGMPRSGTKLLRGLLEQHPRVRIPGYETDFLPHLARWVRDRGAPDTEGRFSELYGSLRSAPYFSFRERDHGPMDWRVWREACAGRFDAAGLFEGFVRAETGVRPGEGVIWGDKSPAYIAHLELITSLYPQARIIHLVRDVRDYCVSIRNAWGKDVRRAAVRWNADVTRAHEWVQRMPGQFCEVRYESLLDSPESELRRLSELLGIPFDTAMLHTNRPVEGVGRARGRTDIKRDNSGGYAAALRPAELAAIEALAWDGMQALGYTPVQAREARRLRPATLAALRLKDGVALALNGARQRGLLGSVRFFASHQRVSRS